MKIDTNNASKSLKLDSIQDLIKESSSKDKSVLEPEELEGKKESENNSDENNEESSSDNSSAKKNRENLHIIIYIYTLEDLKPHIYN